MRGMKMQRHHMKKVEKVRNIRMRYQVCEIKNGNLKHFYRSNRTGEWFFSSNKATMLELGQAREILRDLPGRDLFIQSEYDCHFREIDSNGYCISMNIDDDLDAMLDSYGMLGDRMEREMHDHGVSWSDFI